MGNERPDTKERVGTIDGLRGLAALAVVLYHYVGFIPLVGLSVGTAGAAVVAATRHGHLGVQVFFVLSGYVIAMTADRYAFTAGTGARFVLRRLVRLAPPYWAMILLISTTVVAGKAAGVFRSASVTAAQVAAHLGYVQDVLGFPPLDIVYWTLCLEVQFYLVFAVSAVALRRLAPGFRVAWFAALVVGSAAIDLADAVPQEWFPRLWYQFGVGVLAYSAGRDRSARVVLGVLLAALVALGVSYGREADVVVAAVAGLLVLVARGSRLTDSCPAPLVGLGRISYSLYLVHGFLGLWLSVAFRSGYVRSEPAAWALIAVWTAVAVGCAALFYRAVEVRAVSWSRRVRVGPRPESAGPPAPATRFAADDLSPPPAAAVPVSSERER